MKNGNLKYGKVYCCKRTRLLEQLLMAGFRYFAVVPERPDGRYFNWLFENTPELESFIEGYFAAKR